MTDDNLVVYQMRENRYKLTEIASAMHKELFYIEDIIRQNNRIGKRLYREDNEWQRSKWYSDSEWGDLNALSRG